MIRTNISFTDLQNALHYTFNISYYTSEFTRKSIKTLIESNLSWRNKHTIPSTIYIQYYDYTYVHLITESELYAEIENKKVYSTIHSIYILEKDLTDHQPVLQNSDNTGFYCNQEATGGTNDRCYSQCLTCDENGPDFNIDPAAEIYKELEPLAIESKSKKTIWDLDYHESLIIEGKMKDYLVLRVPGGWLYKPSGRGMSAVPNTFVPYEAQKFNTGCVLCGNTIESEAQRILSVLDKLNNKGESIENNKELLKLITDTLKNNV